VLGEMHVCLHVRTFDRMYGRDDHASEYEQDTQEMRDPVAEMQPRSRYEHIHRDDELRQNNLRTSKAKTHTGTSINHMTV